MIYFQIKTSEGLRYCLQPVQNILQKTLLGIYYFRIEIIFPKHPLDLVGDLI